MNTTQWIVDSAHSEIQFKVKHLVISTVTGFFREFKGEANVPEDTFEGGEITVLINASSINTNNEQRDGHLKSADFFETDRFPEIKIKTTSIKQVNEEDYTITADITIKGVTREVHFLGEYGGKAKDGYGNEKVGLEITGKLNRKDFGLNWNAVIEGGGLTVSEEVKIIANLQFIRQ